MAAHSVGIVNLLPTDLLSGLNQGAVRVEDDSAVYGLGTCTFGAGNLYLLRWCPEAGKWYRRGQPFAVDATKNDGQFELVFYSPWLTAGYYLIFSPYGLTFSESFLEEAD